jgi:hypothetical protein
MVEEFSTSSFFHMAVLAIIGIHLRPFYAGFWDLVNEVARMAIPAIVRNA